MLQIFSVINSTLVQLREVPKIYRDLIIKHHAGSHCGYNFSSYNAFSVINSVVLERREWQQYYVK